MELKRAVRTCLSKYATFSGRAPRSEFWWFILSVWVIGLILGAVDLTLFGQSETITTDTSISMSRETQFAPFSSIFGLLVLLPSLSVAVRRLHDIARSGWWILLGLIPLIGTIILLVWYASKGTEGPNRFGDDPLG